MAPDLQITQIGATGFAQLWPIFNAVIADGDTYSYPPDLDQATACAMWTSAPARCFVVRRVDDSGNDRVVGGYTLRPNQPGLCNHVANAGYMVAPDARGQGIASRLCEHSLEQARHAGFTAMQFNFVVSSNAAAVRLWQRHGFVIVGQIPGAFRHTTLGPTDVYVMHRQL